MTSPSWPVMISLPEPGIAVASTNRTSPPTGVQARPVATPGTSVRRRCSDENLRLPSSSRARFAVDRRPCRDLALRDLAGDLAEDGADLALEVADAGLARVLLDDHQDRVVGDLDLVGLDAVGLELAGHQVLLGDVELLVDRVAGELDHLHPVLQRRRDRVEDVRRGDEEHVREVERAGRGSGPGSSSSGPGRAPRAWRWPDRPGSPRPSCRSRRSSAPGCGCPRRAGRG